MATWFLPVLGQLKRLADAVARDVAYSISCLSEDLAKAMRFEGPNASPAVRAHLAWALEVISHAWSQFLCADIDDIVVDVHNSGLWMEGG